MKLNTTVAPFILRGVALLGADSANCPMALRQKIWNKLAVEWRPDRVHDQVRTIDFDELPTHFDAYLKGMVRGRTVVADRAGSTLAPHPGAPRQVARSLTAEAAGRRAGTDPGRSVRWHDRTRSSIAARSPTATRSGASEAALVDWQTPFSAVLDYSKPPFAKWFVGGRTNLCHNAVDRHLADARRPDGADLHLDRDRRGEDATRIRELARRGEPLRRDAARRRAWAAATAC